MRDNLDDALKLMFGHEGGYVNDPDDPGGPTKFGITQKTLAAHRGRSVNAADVKAMSLSEAEEIYRRSYWSQSGGDLLPAGLDYAAFDFGVNSGPAQAVKTLQRVLGARADGSVGEMTARAARDYAGGARKLIADYCAARLAFMRGLKGWKKYGRGWTSRVNDVSTKAQAMVVGVKPTIAPRPIDAEAVSTGGAKAPPEKPNVALTPEAIGGAVATSSGAIATLSGVEGPLAWALAAAVVVAACVAAFYFVRRFRASEP